MLIGAWFINPTLDPGNEGSLFPFSVTGLTTLVAEGCDVVEDYVLGAGFPDDESRKRVRVLRRVT